MDFITNNIEWVFGGIGVPIVIYLIKKFFLNSENMGSSNSLVNNVVVNNNLTEIQRSKNEVHFEEPSKNSTRILFIDDKYADFKMVSILKKSGWANTKSVKDITDLGDLKVIEAEIIFVDINGVGATLFQDQGLGLASALKKKYPHKKIILYSAETTGDRFHKALREVDDCLYKDAEPYQFINLIESYTKIK